MKNFNLVELKMLLENQKKVTRESWGTETYFSNQQLQYKLEDAIKDREELQESVMKLMGVK